MAKQKELFKLINVNNPAVQKAIQKEKEGNELTKREIKLLRHAKALESIIQEKAIKATVQKAAIQQEEKKDRITQEQKRSLFHDKQIKLAGRKKKRQRYLRFRSIYAKATYSFNIYFGGIVEFFKKTKEYLVLTIRLTQNNVFCTLRNKDKKTILIGSGGKYKIKTSKNRIKFSSDIILKSFLKEIKDKISKNKLLINITAPKKLKKKIINQLSQTIKNKTMIININHKKSFNGCRPKKQKRKKRKGLRIFK
jgi:ribosomal protein S11